MLILEISDGFLISVTIYRSRNGFLMALQKLISFQTVISTTQFMDYFEVSLNIFPIELVVYSEDP